jgi:integrase
VPLLQQQSARQLPDAWVFARHDGMKPILVDAAFVIACQRARIEDFVFHDLRHSCASFLAMSGASLREIMEVLGHTNIQQTAKYTHLTTSHTAGVLQRMADQFLAGVLLASTLTTLASVWIAVG